MESDVNTLSTHAPEGVDMVEEYGYLYNPNHPLHRGKRASMLRELGHKVGFENAPYSRNKRIPSTLLQEIADQLGVEVDGYGRKYVLSAFKRQGVIETKQKMSTECRLGEDEVQQLIDKL